MSAPISSLADRTDKGATADDDCGVEWLRILTEECTILLFDYDSGRGEIELRGPVGKLLDSPETDGATLPFEALMERLHADDRAMLRSQLEAALHHDERICTLLRVHAEPSRYRTFNLRGTRVRQTPHRVVGTLLEVCENELPEHALRQLLEHTAATTGPEFFDRLVEQAGRLLRARRVLVARRLGATTDEMEVVAAWQDQGLSQRENFSAAPGSASWRVLREGSLHIADGLAEQCPLHAARYHALGITGYVGVALTVGRTEPLGVLAVLYADHQPPQAQAAHVLRLFASRAAAELERLQHVAAIERLNAELEQRVADRTAQLLASNTELEAFSYSVSHDLRAPLRAIAGFSRALEEDYREKLNDTGLDYLQRIKSSAKRMGDLIDDLLNLARISRGELRLQTVDLSALARQLGAEAAAHRTGQPVDFRVAPSLSVRADPELLRVALTNLIDNAWKYTRHTAAARVELTTLPAPDEFGATVYLLRDNGAGFDMRYAGKLFGAFQRLHHVDDFEGTGIGLATVRRILHRHGGRIWAEASPGTGARFYFTLQRGPTSS